MLNEVKHLGTDCDQVLMLIRDPDLSPSAQDDNRLGGIGTGTVKTI
jgi:hypothetical protein